MISKEQVCQTIFDKIKSVSTTMEIHAECDIDEDGHSWFSDELNSDELYPTVSCYWNCEFSSSDYDFYVAEVKDPDFSLDNEYYQYESITLQGLLDKILPDDTSQERIDRYNAEDEYGDSQWMFCGLDQVCDDSYYLTDCNCVVHFHAD